MADLRITYGRQSDRAYIYFSEASTQAAESRICAEVGDPVEVIVDYDQSGVLLGIEILQASRLLSRGLLDQAEEIA